MNPPADHRAVIEQWLTRRAHTATEDRTAVVEDTGRISLGQRGLWFQGKLGERENTGSAFCYRLRGQVHHESLTRAFEAVIARHEPLRTRYVYERDEPSMVVDPPAPLALDVVPVEAPPGDHGVDWLVPAVQHYVSRPFDLGRDTALRARLWRLAEDDHVLAFVVHHIAFDGWSLGVFHNEVSHFYGHFRHGSPVTLPPLPTSYRAFAEEQRKSVDEGRFAEHAAYWRAQLRSAPPLLDLPTDRPRPVVQSFTGDLHPAAVPAEVCRALGAVAEQEGASLSMALVAGYALFLSRWTREDDVVIGLPVANRATAAVEQLIGMFVNLLPIRVALDPALTFRELLRRVRATMLAAFDHQALPFDEIVQDHRRPDEDQWSTPIVNVALALQTADRGRLVFGEATVEPLMVHERTSIFDFTLTIGPDVDGFAGYVEYNRDLFDAETIARMTAALGVTLAHCAERPDEAIGALSLTDAEPGGSASGGEPRSAVAPTGGLLSRFQATARRDPERPAVRDRRGDTTYADLRADVETLAARLVEAGVVPGSVVGVHLPGGKDLLTAFLAIVWAGGVYLPLDPVHPAQRLREIIRDSAAGHVVTDTSDGLPQEPELVTVASGTGTRIDPVAVTGSAPAYLLYTSGSTGKPKGVLVSRDNLDHLVVAQDALPVEGMESFAAVATPSFDASIWEMVLPLGRGGRLDVLGPENLAEGLAEFGTQVITSTPSLLSTVERLPDTVRVVIAAGEVLPDALARDLERSACVVNAYGPTEITVCASFSTTARGQDTRSIGTALPGVGLHVLDDNLHDVPRGAVGEICVSGAGVAIGYHGDEELTRARFVRTTAVPGERLYRTGDLGRWGTDGCLYYLGRLDDQVKVNGQRVQLADIEAAARRASPVVSAAAYLGRTTSGTYLGLAVCADESADRDEVVSAALRACAERLAPGVVPTRVRVVPELPLTPSGKTDRVALAGMAPAENDADGTTVVQPHTEVEVEIAAIWSSVLDRPVNDVTSTLYSLGGQSLQAVRIISEIRRRFGVRIPVRGFLSAPTVAALAERVDAELDR